MSATRSNPRSVTLPIAARPAVRLPGWRSGAGDQRGSASLELVLVAPGLLLLSLVIIAGGRLAQAHQAVSLASAQAARATALAASPAAGATVGRSTASGALSALGLHCHPAATTVHSGGLARVAGTAATVSVSVSCSVALADLTPGLPGHVNIDAVATEPVDRWVTR